MSRTEKAGNYILTRMRNELNSSMFYHNVTHVLDVLNAAETIGKLEKISDQEMELLQVAALFHDAGFIISAEDHEQLSCDIARKFLPEIGFTKNELEVICKLILATCVPQNPTTHLEQIMCDADLDYLGRDDFFTTGNNIFMEFMARNLVSDKRAWDQMQVKFLTAHHYFTPTSIRLRSDKKAEHLLKIKKLLEERV